MRCTNETKFPSNSITFAAKILDVFAGSVNTSKPAAVLHCGSSKYWLSLTVFRAVTHQLTLFKC